MRPSRSRPAFTMVELIVALAIVAGLVAALLPALSKARAVAVASKDAAQIRAVLEAANNYSSDFSSYFPVARQWDEQDWYPATMTPWSAAADKNAWPCLATAGFTNLWGQMANNNYGMPSGLLRGPAYQQFGRTYDSGAAPGITDSGTAGTTMNWYLGFGALVGENYVPIQNFFTPTQQNSLLTKTNGKWIVNSYARAALWNQSYQNPYVPTDGLGAWSAWVPDNSLYQAAGYSIRYCDWGVTTFDPVTHLATAQTDNRTTIRLANLRIDTPGFSSKVQMMDDGTGYLAPLLNSANVGWSDTHVRLWESTALGSGQYSYSASHPNNTDYFNNNVAGVASWDRLVMMNAAEAFSN